MDVVNERTTVGTLDLGELPRQWRKLDFLNARAPEVREGRGALLTRSQVDVSRPGGHRLYSGVERSLSAARDCDLALRSLLEHHGATQAAMWALLRGQFEASFWALWLLDPEDSLERVARGIAAEWLDDRASMTYFREFADDCSFPFVDEDRRHVREQAANDHAATYRREASANGRWWVRPPEVNLTRALTELSLMQGGPQLR